TDTNIQQIVVAIWSINIDKFEDGNMHRIEEGTEIKTDGVTQKAKTIPAKEAKKIIQAQWRDANHVVKLLEIDDAIASSMFNLPIEEFNAEEKDIVYARVLEWKKRWLSYDVDSLMELYSSEFGGERYDVDKWKDLKKKLGDKHGRFKVDIGDIHIQWMGDVVVASFPQHFKSNVMDSIGTKVLYFIYEGGTLKIIDESWFKGDYKPAVYPFVVGVASHSLFDNMMDRMDIMRRKGYSAYNVSFMNKGRKHHKIFVERFSSKEEANAFAEKLLKDKIVDYAFPMNAPYYVEAGSYKMREEAIYTIKRLASVGYTSYPLVTCKAQACNYKIIVGAFKDRGSALFLSNKLGKAGIGGSSVRP
ncbi:MAG: SPOR domain-containing protein, partial [Nitrospinae bacterium]|nr:SPOR domain-containing protein [Nitrospinota bacterium]